MPGTNKTTAAPTSQSEPVATDAIAAMMPSAKSAVPCIDLRRVSLFRSLFVATTNIVARSHDPLAKGSVLQRLA